MRRAVLVIDQWIHIGVTKRERNMYFTVELNTLLNATQLQVFKDWFDKTIGTDYETDRVNVAQWCMTMYDCTWDEIQKIKEFEKRELPKYDY